MENQIRHLAIIMDGNGRWAKMRGLDRTMGHREGLNRAEDVISWSMEVGIKYLSLYVFSTENWKRTQAEIGSLFGLAEKYLNKFEKFCKDQVKITVSGEREKLPPKLVKKIDRIEENTAKFDKINVNLLINYGGRREIVEAVKKLQDLNQDVSEESLLKNMYQDIPDPDLIVRTGGQMRLSNFLLFQSAYSELYFSDTLWPDFSREEFDKILSIFSKRVRNFGG